MIKKTGYFTKLNITNYFLKKKQLVADIQDI